MHAITRSVTMSLPCRYPCFFPAFSGAAAGAGCSRPSVTTQRAKRSGARVTSPREGERPGSALVHGRPRSGHHHGEPRPPSGRAREPHRAADGLGAVPQAFEARAGMLEGAAGPVVDHMDAEAVRADARADANERGT